ncbi:hypothetical protein WR25_26519 [Diploscapter pachys]|uniref:ABC transmembrane type-1 domain-containing protein n=1 Tax=Diploscapter pachys TaxID=2018661 RepID=A0A2A2LIQ4_9BILA|nr:hypothetical protein WR25_26519 [Diploscapter pachys]
MLGGECRLEWPISPGCSHILGAILFDFLAIVNIISILLPNTSNSYSRFSHYLSCSFVVSAICLAFLVANDVSYCILIAFARSHYSHVLMAFCIGKATFSNFSRKVSLIAPYVWPKKSIGLQLRVLFCIFLLVLGRLINIAIPLYSKWIVDELAHPETFHYSLIFISSALKFLQGSGPIGGFLNTCRIYLWIPIQQYTTRELEVELFAHLHSLSLRWHLSRKTGLVLRVMDRGTSSVNSILNYILFNIVPTIADIAISVVFFLSTFNLYFGILVFITMVLYLVTTIVVTEWRTAFQREMIEKDNAASAMGTDSLLNYETVKYYGNEEYEVNRFRKAIESYQLAEWRSNASLAILNSLQNGIIGIGLAAGSLLAAYLITIDQKLTIGDYVLFTTYILQLYSPLNFFGTVYRVIQKSFVDMENMFDLINEEIEVKDEPCAIEYQPDESVISVKNLTFSYTPEVTVLKNISFEVAKGETIALVGSSGSGKSTIIRLLFRLFEANEYSISYDGVDIRSLTLKSLRKQIGIVPQDTVLFNETILYNIRFGNPEASDEEVFEAAKAAMIHDKILALPDGYDTVVGERGLKLSGGEKQRVAIARTILKKPQFIFLDEATSALDTKASFFDIHICNNRFSSNSPKEPFNNALRSCAGRELECHTTLLANRGVYYQMWMSQNNQEKEKTAPEEEKSSE